MDEHWDYVTVEEMDELIPILKLMEKLHEAMYSSTKREEHAILSKSYREAIDYLRRLYEEGNMLPF